MATYLYGRVSTDDQSLSADNQRQMLLEHAAAKGIVPDGVFIDQDVSGGTPIRRRPEASKMFTLLQSGDRVVVLKLDRGFRNTVDALTTVSDYRALGVEFVFLDLGIDTSTPSGWMMFSVFAAGAEYERARIAERVRDAWAYLRRNNKPYATARPWGWVRTGKGKDGSWVPCPKERAVAMRVLSMRQGGLGWEKIACRLAAEGVEKPVFRKGVRPVYYPSDVWGLAKAAADGFPTQRPMRKPKNARVRKPSSQGFDAPLPTPAGSSLQ
jgi:putative DNA-invertase from lambdoid prophage Rac